MTERWAPHGSARGRIVLLHGTFSLARTWWQIGPALAERGFEVQAVDLAGHGDAPPLGRPLDLDALVSGVEGQLDGAVDLLAGHSLGAVVALRVAARRPDLVRALALEDPPGRRIPGRDDFADGLEADAALVRTDRAALLRRTRERNPRWAPEDVEHDVEGIAAADAVVVAAGFRGAGLAIDTPALIVAVAQPVLVLAASDGESALGRARAEVRRLVSPGRFVEIEGGHCLHRDDPAAWLAAVCAFADEILAAGDR